MSSANLPKLKLNLVSQYHSQSHAVKQHQQPSTRTPHSTHSHVTASDSYTKRSNTDDDKKKSMEVEKKYATDSNAFHSRNYGSPHISTPSSTTVRNSTARTPKRREYITNKDSQGKGTKSMTSSSACSYNSSVSHKKSLNNIRPVKRRDNAENNPWIMTSKINKDPLNANMSTLFEILWEKATPAGSQSYQSCPGISIPDTICFTNEQYSHPKWYFTSQQDGRIYKKNAVNVTPDNIFRTFTKKKLGNTVKRYMETSKHPEIPVKTSIVAYGVFEHNLVGQRFITTEFYDAKGLRYFLEKHTKETKTGFIQKFLPPSGSFNKVLKVQWTPCSIIVDMVKNKLKLDDRNAALRDRTTTEEGDPNTFVTSVVSPIICAQVEKLCKAIVRHIHLATLTYHQVREMSLYMKVDCHGKLWFLWFLSLHTSTKTLSPDRPIRVMAWKANFTPPPALQHQYLDIPRFSGEENRSETYDFTEHIKAKSQTDNTIRLQPKSTPSNKMISVTQGSIDNKLSQYLTCPSCSQTYELRDAVSVSYLVAILEFEQMGNENSSDDLNYSDNPDLSQFHHVIVPPIIRCLEPSIGSIRYKKNRDNPVFLRKLFRVCENCAVNYIETARSNGLNLLGDTILKTKSTNPSERIVELAQSKSPSFSKGFINDPLLSNCEKGDHSDIQVQNSNNQSHSNISHHNDGIPSTFRVIHSTHTFREAERPSPPRQRLRSMSVGQVRHV